MPLLFAIATLSPLIPLALGLTLGGWWILAAVLAMTALVAGLDGLVRIATPALPDEVEFPAGPLLSVLLGLAQLALLIGLAAALVLAFVVARTVFGFRLRAVGENAAAARYAGIGVSGTLLKVGLLSGGLAGLAGVGEVAGLKGYLTADISSGFGYAGIVVAMLAGLSPIGCIFAAFFISAIAVGADSMSRALGVSSYLADLLVATSLMAILIGEVFARYRIVRSEPVTA